MSLAPAAITSIQSMVLDWYASNGRDLAFRHTSDPWAILVSEVIAQQTQAARAAEAWTRFMTEFPTPAALAAASPAAVIRAWRGIGYNRRAIALRSVAIAIVEEHGGLVPDTLDVLVRLPGIGPYTARAVLAIAFNRPVAALDVNIRRVLGRAFLPAELPVRRLQQAADDLVPSGEAAAWTHALMDVGAAFCRPREPRCEACPLHATCRYRAALDAGDAVPAPKRRSGSAGSGAPVRFELTTRWLRGRILDRLRDATSWVTFDGPMGSHDRDAVQVQVARLAAEGMIEMAGDRARLHSS